MAAEKRFRVVVAGSQHGPLDVETRILGDLATLDYVELSSEEQLWGHIDDADAYMMFHTVRIGSATIERMKRCKLIVRCGVGYDNVDYVFARSKGIPVANVPDYGTEEVADSAIGLTLALTRGIAFQNALLRDPAVPWHFDHVRPLRRLRGETFGIVGLGRIGSAVAVRAKALGMNVVFYDPYKTDGYDKSLGITRLESLDELLSAALVISCHCPLTPETENLFATPTISRMRRGSYLINTARGGIVDTPALVPAIESGQLAGAAIDVLPIEPAPVDHPLLVAWRDPSHPCHMRVVLNAHNAFYSEEGVRDMRVKGSEACRRALLGQPLRNVIH
jgi:D-3-phosphoglycerate dehydrogenase/C-terminal binding protein